MIVIENLHVQGMIRNHKLAKSRSDCGWGIFVNFLSYKARTSTINNYLKSENG
ncbi:MAG: hypothetical protein F6K39_03030 [Okeania sp. SIO3B3]|nr:hypothetical protein [Okeania sp. SIO3B3]